MPLPRPPRGNPDPVDGGESVTPQRSPSTTFDTPSDHETFTVNGFDWQAEDFGAPDILDIFKQLPAEDIQAATTTRAVALLNFLRLRCASTIPKPGPRGGKARDILRHLHGHPDEIVPDIDPPDDPPATAATVDVRNRRVLFPAAEEESALPMIGPTATVAGARPASALRAALETAVPIFPSHGPGFSAKPGPVSADNAPPRGDPSRTLRASSAVASPDLVRLGPSFAQQVQRQAQGSVSLFVGARQWQSIRNRREAETWAFVLDELVKMYGWGIAATLAFEAAARRLAALTEVDQGEEWSTMADVELIPAGTVLLPDAIRKAMVSRAKVENSRSKGKLQPRGGGGHPSTDPPARD